MGIVIVKGKLTAKDFNIAKKDYKTYIKITSDIVNDVVVLGGEYHADGEKILIEAGSKQGNIWGGGVSIETGRFETNAIINLRTGNDSTDILDPKVREIFIKLSKRIFNNYVKQR